MTIVKKLIWDEWNKEHIAKHNVTPEGVGEVCHGEFSAIESYRGRLQLSGTTKNGRRLTVILSPQDNNLVPYDEGIFYPITSFEEEP